MNHEKTPRGRKTVTAVRKNSLLRQNCNCIKNKSPTPNLQLHALNNSPKTKNDCISFRGVHAADDPADPRSGCPTESRAPLRLPELVLAAPDQELLLSRGGHCHLACVFLLVDQVTPTEDFRFHSASPSQGRLVQCRAHVRAHSLTMSSTSARGSPRRADWNGHGEPGGPALPLHKPHALHFRPALTRQAGER